MSENKTNKPTDGKPPEVVGRDPRIDLSRFTVTILGRDVIDYERLMREEPELYNEILAAEKKSIKLN